MDAIGIYVEHVNRKKSEIEEEMYYLLEQNIEFERAVRVGEDARKRLEKNRERLVELANTYLKVKGDI